MKTVGGARQDEHAAAQNRLHSGPILRSIPARKWPSRDPIEEDDGPSMYAFVGNSPTNAFDSFGDAAEWHHLLPQAWEAQFSRLGINIHDPKYGLVLDALDHRTGETALHRSGWNRDWDDFFGKNSNPTKKQVIAKLQRMYRDPKYSAAIRKGKKARLAYSAWRSAATSEREALHALTKNGVKKLGGTYRKVVPILSVVFIVQDVEAKGLSGGIVNTLFDSTPYLNWVKLGSECVLGEWVPDGDAPEVFEFKPMGFTIMPPLPF